MNIPEVRINFSWLLYEGESKELYDNLKDKSTPLITYEDAESKAELYRKAWAKHEGDILSAMQQVVDLKFYQPVIDVSLAPMFVPKSDPLIINLRYEPNHFVDTLTHELWHVLLTDNNKVSIKNNYVNLVEKWERLFGNEHSFKMLVHIPVMAGCKYIFNDILNEPKRQARDVDDTKTWGESGKDYLDAWEYVDSHDYKEILSQLKGSYSGVK